MGTIDYYLMPVDIKDAHVLTRAVERTVRESDIWDIPFAPITDTNSRRIKLRVKNVDGAGLASFKAENADTPVVGASGDITELYMELLLIAEKDVLKTSDLIALESPDHTVAAQAAGTILEKAVVLRRRNINRTRWMAWQAVQDALTISYPDGTTIAIDFDLDGDAQNDWFGATHKVTVSTAWSDTSADIIGDVYNATYRIAEDLGVSQEECIMYVSSKVWTRYLRRNTGIKAELSDYQPRIITPTIREVPDILGLAAVRIYNGFYVAEGASTRTKFLDDGHVLITGPDTVDGVPLMEIKDGPVARVVNGDIVVANNPGALSEIYINEEAITKNVRVQTARIPQMNYPAGFYWLDIAP